MSVAFVLAAVLLTVYVLVGALDLGVGLLLPLAMRGRDRDAMLDGGGRSWSAGAVWTLVAFALLVAGLPLALVSLRALWPVLALMLLSLAVRGGVSALRPHVLRQDLCDLLFGLASLLAVLGQGLALGWFVSGLGTALPVRHAGPFGTISAWGVLCSAGLVGLYALLGSGWLVWSGRDAVRVFGREVGRAAAILTAGALVLCAAWALPTGVVTRVFEQEWPFASAPALLAVGSLALLVPFCLSLWGSHPALPFACSTFSALCGLSAVAVLLLSSSLIVETSREISFADYLIFILLLGSPAVIVDLVRRRAALGRTVEAASIEAPSQAGRRSGSLANSLHLS